jgi:hypothetical protein
MGEREVGSDSQAGFDIYDSLTITVCTQVLPLQGSTWGTVKPNGHETGRRLKEMCVWGVSC